MNDLDLANFIKDTFSKEAIELALEKIKLDEMKKNRVRKK